MTLHAYLTADRLQLLRDETEHLILSQRGTTERGEDIHYLVETLRPLIAHKRLTPTTYPAKRDRPKVGRGPGAPTGAGLRGPHENIGY